MKVLFVTSEASPFIKTGGLGDVMGALPKALDNINIESRVILPKYKNIKKEFIDIMKFVKWIMIPVGWRNQYCGLFKVELNNIIYYFIDNEYYFGRHNAYGYDDDCERFAFFNRAVLNVIEEINYKPNIIHCNDWQTGMIPVLLKCEYNKKNFYKDIKTMFSVHNLLFKGQFNADVLPEFFGYDYSNIINGGLEFHGDMSFLKGGLNYCDQITTVSRTYAEEIQTPEFGEGLDGIFRERSCYFKGILNGIDYKEFDPEHDELIFEKYNLSNLSNKLKNKLELQKYLGLPEKSNIPIIGLVSRLTNQKGCDLIIDISDKLLKKDIQIVILGTGDNFYEEKFKELQFKYPNKVSANIKFDNEIAHKIYAGSDLFLMPSLFEPCGLGQLIALKYGSVPIVRETGGLKDTIQPFNKFNNTGNGFSFKNYNSNDLINTIEFSLEMYNNKYFWNIILENAMKSNNSWENSAQEYKDLYEGLMKR